MPEITGEIIRIYDKKAKNGDAYTAIQLKGQKNSFFDWDGHYEQVETKTGDTVKISYSGEKYLRIGKIEKLAEGAKAAPVENQSYPDREISIARSIALKCSCELVKDSNLTCEPDYITSLAEKFEKWLLR